MQTIIYRINNRVLLYSTGNYIQYPVITYSGKEHEKEYMCVYIYIYVNHFAVQQKLTQHCKSTILQFREREIPIELKSSTYWNSTSLGDN